ncbi:FAS1 domain-containing protein [Favolaschia claudopus]|uniref:FAS1 domain-containing protein n=1 Tax=Favolaschia claudopus TaxID=2862362 RepID=A0AAW0C8D1_9AGAR
MRLQLCSILALPLLHALASQGEQVVMDSSAAHQSMKPTLADLLTIESSTSIFYSYARELTLSNMLSSTGAVTIFAPTNKAIMALARKPHQDPMPVDDDIVVTEEEYDSRSKENVERWVSAHIVPESPINFDQTYTLLNGKPISFKKTGADGKPDWSQVVIGDGVRIIGEREASNGVLYLIDGTISLD